MTQDSSVVYVDVPYKPSKLQAKIHRSLKRFNVIVLHRGAGKTYLCLNELVKSAFTCETNGLFLYVAPEKQQAKDVAWSDLKKIVAPISGLKVRDDELSITFPETGAMIRLEGADKPDRLRGIHPRGVVLDEVGQMKRDTWYEAIFPAVQRNNGWVIFIGTPKGENLFKELYDMGSSLMNDGDPRWFTAIEDVYSAGVYSNEWIEQNKHLMIPAKWEQEYLCAWDAAFNGAYYADILLAPDSKIIGDVPYNPMYPVMTGWDVGLGDPTCVWFVQYIENLYKVIDYYESTDKDIYGHIRAIQSKPYRYAYHVVPHDINQRNWETKNSRWDLMTRAGMKLVQAKKSNSTNEVIEGINIVISNLAMTRFDKDKCAKGIQSLLSYRAQEDKLTGGVLNKPSHHSSDAADALRTFFVGVRKHNLGVAAEWEPWWDNNFKKKSAISSEYDLFNI